MKVIKMYFAFNIFIMLSIIMPYLSYSQITESECLKTFNLFVFEKLLNLDTNNNDLSSNNVRLIFELSVSDCGRIDSVILGKSNLKDLGISETALISFIIGNKFPCIRDLRDIYYKGELYSQKIGIVYNTYFLE